jgi:predicted secreted Zn-dependent protease
LLKKKLNDTTPRDKDTRKRSVGGSSKAAKTVRVCVGETDGACSWKTKGTTARQKYLLPDGDNFGTLSE